MYLEKFLSLSFEAKFTKQLLQEVKIIKEKNAA
jgi:hypothetical protein